MFGLGAGEIFVIFVFALIFIGPKKLPELARGLGKGIREFQKAKDDFMGDVVNADSDDKEEISQKVSGVGAPQKTSETPASENNTPEV